LTHVSIEILKPDDAPQEMPFFADGKFILKLFSKKKRSLLSMCFFIQINYKAANIGEIVL
jgi:hypothetical protein